MFHWGARKRGATRDGLQRRQTIHTQPASSGFLPLRHVKHGSGGIAFGVGRWLEQILVTGNCTWKVGITRLGNTPTDAAPFSAMLVSFENAYGGREPAGGTGLRATCGAELLAEPGARRV